MLQSVLMNTLINLLHRKELNSNLHHLGEGIRMATIARPVKGKKVAVDRIRFLRSLLLDMKEPRISGVFCVWGTATCGRKYSRKFSQLRNELPEPITSGNRIRFASSKS